MCCGCTTAERSRHILQFSLKENLSLQCMLVYFQTHIKLSTKDLTVHVLQLFHLFVLQQCDE